MSPAAFAMPQVRCHLEAKVRLRGGTRLGAPAMTKAISEGTLQGLRGAFSGRLIAPGDADYDQERQVHNGLVDKRPGLIAACQNTADIVDAAIWPETPRWRSRSEAGGTTWPARRSPTGA